MTDDPVELVARAIMDRIEQGQASYRDMAIAAIAAMRVPELQRLKNRIDTILNNVLCDMKPGWDDSIEGFNKAWDISRDIFQEEIGRATALALQKDAANDHGKALDELPQITMEQGLAMRTGQPTPETSEIGQPGSSVKRTRNPPPANS